MAVYYTALGEDAFRDSSLPLESGFRADVQRLEVGLAHAIGGSLGAAHQGWVADGARYEFNGPLQVSAVVPVQSFPDELAIRIEGLWGSGLRVGNIEQWFNVAVPTGHPEIIGPNYEVVAYRVEPSGASGVGPAAGNPSNVPETILFPPRRGAGSSRLELPPSVALELTNVERGYEGDPSVASDEFWRMVYFSATTITTLGVGDIQPVSDAARTAVTVEAALGILLAGLFLAALARRIAGERDAMREV
jgi:hypothetical protein